MKGSETIPQGSTLRRSIIDAREAPRTLTLLNLFEVFGAGDKIVHPSLKKGDQCNQLVPGSNPGLRAELAGTNCPIDIVPAFLFLSSA